MIERFFTPLHYALKDSSIIASVMNRKEAEFVYNILVMQLSSSNKRIFINAIVLQLKCFNYLWAFTK